MKTKITLIILLITVIGYSQNGINYKAVIKDDLGNVVANDNIFVQFAILENGVTNLYTETHSIATDDNGIIIVNIGEGTPTSGNFSNIDWAVNNHFLNVQVNTGSGFVDMGTTPFKSVPYAKSAENAENAVSTETIVLPYFDSTTESFGPAFHVHNTDTNASYGLAGSTGSSTLPANRAGVLGYSTNAHGVFGVSENSFFAGVQGVSGSSEGFGILGYGFGGGVGGHFYTTSFGVAALTTGVGNVGIGIDEPEEKMHVAGNLLVQSNLGNLQIGYPGDGNRWALSTINLGTTLQYRSKPSGSNTYTTRFRMNQDGEFQMGTSVAPNAWAHIRHNSTTVKPHLKLEEVGNDFARLELTNDVNSDAFWHVAGLPSSTSANAKLNFYFRNASGAADRMTITGNGQVGINNTNPDEELVIGTNLGSGWVIPAATIGNNVGGALQVGNLTTKFSIESSSTFDRARLIATNANGYGEGTIEIRAANIAIGKSPGITDATLELEHDILGFFIQHEDNTDNYWELYSSASTTSPDLLLYTDNGIRGRFDEVSGNYTATSDARLKTNISPTKNVLANVLSLQPKMYNYRVKPGKTYYGFLAQDLIKIFPELVTEVKGRDAEASTLLVDYSQLSSLTIKAIQEQQAIIEDQQKQIDELKTLVQTIINKQ